MEEYSDWCCSVWQVFKDGSYKFEEDGGDDIAVAVVVVVIPRASTSGVDPVVRSINDRSAPISAKGTGAYLRAGKFSLSLRSTSSYEARCQTRYSASTFVR